ncbi:MAG: hypothetical protein OFPI_02980 [Osedax symbiont Rs2]|nr:MAG: hypothetical protein OFPI_02980 [Osedax symbiont Rs2]
MPGTRISSALLYLLLSILGIATAQLSWKLVALDNAYAPQLSIANISGGRQNSPADSRNALNTISVNHLFGLPLKAQVVAVKKTTASKTMQKTRLNIRLTGLLNGDPSVAVIVYKGVQGAYLVGEYIVDSKALNVQLKSIQHSYVIINNNGAPERLSLPKSNTRTLAQKGFIAKPTSPKNSAVTFIQVDLNSANIKAIIGPNPRQTISKNPLSLSKFLRISPSIEQGQLRGYIISAGADERLLQSVKIRPGDIVTHLDGKAVAGLTLPGVYQSLNNNNRFKVTVNRSGTIITMDIKL